MNGNTASVSSQATTESFSAASPPHFIFDGLDESAWEVRLDSAGSSRASDAFPIPESLEGRGFPSPAAGYFPNFREDSSLFPPAGATTPGGHHRDHPAAPNIVMNLHTRSLPKILIVTPEITRLPQEMSHLAGRVTAKAGGLADVSASLTSALFDSGANVHVALPNYRRLFQIDVWNRTDQELRHIKEKMPQDRLHLAEDRAFYYRDRVYGPEGNVHLALAFQREVINNIIPRVQPDLIHCNDWMTGLVPAAASRLGIPCLFTVHNIHTERVTSGDIEHRGIDPAEFWDRLYYEAHPSENAYQSDWIDLLASGIFAAHSINVVSPTFLEEIVQGFHPFVPVAVRNEIISKRRAGYAHGIINAPDPSYDPCLDPQLPRNYSIPDAAEGKAANKRAFQEALGLAIEPDAPLFFWPSRLDPVQKGPQLLTDILHAFISQYWTDNVQIAVVADGPHQTHFMDIVARHGFQDRVAVRGFDERLSRMGYAASDFTLMPSLFEPCGLPQMIACRYGSLPIVHDTGGLHDTVQHLNADAPSGNGFVFRDFDTHGLWWAMEEAVKFHRCEPAVKGRHIRRIMEESRERFSYATNAAQYRQLYERILGRSVLEA